MVTGDSVILIAKVTHSCNLACKYCFYTRLLDSMSPPTLALEDLKAILLKTARHWQKISLVFHGGEPLLLPLSYFREITQYQKRLADDFGTIFRNSIQTNGTILNTNICEFLKQEGIHLGISLDGTESVHNANRPFKKSASGSFATIIDNVRLAHRHDIRPSALIVATKRVTEDPHSLYRFFKSEGIDIKINELFPEDIPPDFAPTSDELAEFYETLFDLWFYDTKKPILRVRPFTTMIASFWSNKVGDCTYRSNCSKFLVLETDGNLYSCARFSHSEEFRLGNILTESWKDVLASPTISLFDGRRQNLLDLCKRCEWLKQCWGGCSACALKATGSLYGQTRWCKARKRIFEHIKKSTTVRL